MLGQGLDVLTFERAERGLTCAVLTLQISSFLRRLEVSLLLYALNC